MCKYLLDIDLSIVMPLKLVNSGSVWDDSRIDLVIPWHLSIEQLSYTTRFHQQFFNIVFLLPSNSPQLNLVSPYRIYDRFQYTEAAFFSYLKSTDRFAILLWGDELILDTGLPFPELNQDTASQNKTVFLAKKTDVVCGYPLKPFQNNIRGGSINTLVYDTSDLHSLLKPHQSIDYIVDFKILHFSVVGVEGAIKTSANSLNEFRLRGGFSLSFFIRRFVKSELMNLVLLPFRVPFRLWPLSISLKLTSFFSACFLLFYNKYSKTDMSGDPFQLYQSIRHRIDLNI